MFNWIRKIFNNEEIEKNDDRTRFFKVDMNGVLSMDNEEEYLEKVNERADEIAGIMTEVKVENINEKIGKAIDNAAKNLPEGFRVKITIERHGNGVELICPDGDDIDIVDGGDGLSSDIEHATNHAIAQDAENYLGDQNGL